MDTDFVEFLSFAISLDASPCRWVYRVLHFIFSSLLALSRSPRPSTASQIRGHASFLDDIGDLIFIEIQVSHRHLRSNSPRGHNTAHVTAFPMSYQGCLSRYSQRWLLVTSRAHFTCWQKPHKTAYEYISLMSPQEPLQNTAHITFHEHASREYVDASFCRAPPSQPKIYGQEKARMPSLAIQATDDDYHCFATTSATLLIGEFSLYIYDFILAISQHVLARHYSSTSLDISI